MRAHLGKLILVVGIVMMNGGAILAQSSSTNYSIDEFFVGPGGNLDLNSASYSGRATLGDLGSGNFGSTNYQIYAGFTTTNDPYLEAAVNTTDVDLGVLDAGSVSSGTATFSVRTYLASGYVSKIYGGTLTNPDGYEIPALTTQTASSPGTEQFGLNLRDNATPDVGTNPVQVPDSSFSFGLVNANYNTVDQFRFVSGDTIAYANSSSGQTDYTITYIANIIPVTGAGLYQATHSIVTTSTF